MLFSASTSDSLNTSSASSLNTSLLQANSAVLSSSAVSSGLIDPLQQTSLTTSSSSSSAGDLVSLNPQPLPPGISTAIGLDEQLTASTLTTSILTDGVFTPTIPRDVIFGTPGGSTMATATNLGSLNGTRSLFDLFGVSSTSPNDYYRVTLSANSNFNLSMTGLTADADVQFLNSVGQEIARSSYLGSHDEAINLSGLAAGDYYIRVYQYSGSTGFSLDLSSTAPSNLVSREFELGTISPAGTTQTGFISNSNTADVYHFSINGFYQIGSGDLRTSGFDHSSNFNLSLSSLSADADVRIVRDSNRNGIIDPGEEIVRSSRIGSVSETISLGGLGVGDYFAQVYQYNGAATSYTLNLSANGGQGFAPEPNDTLGQAYNLNTLNGTRIFSGHVSGRDPQPWTFDWPRDMNDYYHFSVGATSNFNLSLAGLNGDADVALLNSSGTQIAFSNRLGTASESISQRLVSGDYYVRVYPFSTNSTDYTLNLSATPV